VGQPGKDVVWVPNPETLVEKMLDFAAVTPADFVIDLGSGDGRNVIAAARRGARALGVEFNPDLVALSQRKAAEQNLSERATFVEGDMFEADISKATVLSLFLLSDNLRKLTPRFLDLTPGTRIVVNTFTIPDWEPDERESVSDNCSSWCTMLLWIVPAKAAGTWQIGETQLTLDQKFQMVTGSLTSGSQNTPVEQGRLRGDRLEFVAGGRKYTGKVAGDTIEGQVTQGDSKTDRWKATRSK
jgi:SAM-dependent methyltransferase